MVKKSKSSHILENAYTLFIENGYENTSIEKIAKETNISKGSVYTYFKSKEEILFEVIKIVVQRITDNIQDHSASNLNTFEEEVVSISKDISSYLVKNPAEFQIVSNKDGLNVLSKEEGFVSPFEVLDNFMFSVLVKYGVTLEYVKLLRSTIFTITGDYYINGIEVTDSQFSNLISDLLIRKVRVETKKSGGVNWEVMIKWSSYILTIAVLFGIVVLVLNVVLFVSGKV
jgi:AcrR family transcriptional regulator